MNILIVSIQNLEWDKNGVASTTMDLVRTLKRKGHTVSIISPYHAEALRPPFLRHAQKVIRRMGRFWPCSVFFLAGLDLAARELKHKIRVFPGRVDAVHAHDVVSAWAVLDARRRDARALLTCHFWTEPWEEFAEGGFVAKNGFGYRFLRSLFLKTMRNDRLTLAAVSERNRKLVSSFNPTGPVVVIYPGIAAPSSDQERKLPGHGVPRIVNVGKLERRKNQRILPGIAKELKKRGQKAVFIHIGPEDPEERKFLDAEIGECGVSDFFQFLGPRDREEVFRELGKAALYFNTSTMESFGMTLIEAISAGTPVIALRYDAIEELLPDTPDAVIDPGESPERIADRLMKLLCDAGERNRIAERQNSVFMSRFTADAMARAYEDLYRA